MDVVKDNDLLDLDTNPLHALKQAIESMPEIDANKVRAAIEKLNNGELDILGDEADCLASATRIAQKILSESGQTD